MMPLLAILFAAVAAFGFQPKENDNVTVYMPDSGDGSPCIVQPNCGASSGAACLVLPPLDEFCQTTEAYKIP